MKTINTLIVDDEPLARDNLATLLREEPDITLCGQCASAEAAARILARRGVQLLFLDIEMPGASGFDPLRDVPAEERPHVVFVTAYDEYAVRAFEIGAVDYLSKPFTRQRFTQTLERARGKIRQLDREGLAARIDDVVGQLRRVQAAALVSRTEPTPATGGAGAAAPEAKSDGKIVFKSDGEIHLVPAAEISWLETSGDYLKLHVGNRAHMVRQTLVHMLEQLAGRGFVRIHRSLAVNTAHIRKLWPEEYGEYSVELRDGTRLRASRTFMPALRELI